MTISEFSDTFTTLLNSYNKRADFGDQASRLDIVLDEYEKSVLLTQAQDIILKSYFEKEMNQPTSKGFDDSIRRQMDFSSLIKVDELKTSTTTSKFDERGKIFKLPRKSNTSDVCDVLFILNEKMKVDVTTVTVDQAYKRDANGSKVSKTTGGPASSSWEDRWAATSSNGYEIEKRPSVTKTNVENYVIVPINYIEYDRMMSKPYSQPYKKQAWRLLQSQASGYDMDTELVPRHNIVESTVITYENNLDGLVRQVTKTCTIKYRIRYVRRPQPIILEQLPDGLVIDGQSNASECELNPIMHMDILNKAVEMAIATRAGGAPEHGVTPNNTALMGGR